MFSINYFACRSTQLSLFVSAFYDFNIFPLNSTRSVKKICEIHDHSLLLLMLSIFFCLWNYWRLSLLTMFLIFNRPRYLGNQFQNETNPVILCSRINVISISLKFNLSSKLKGWYPQFFNVILFLQPPVTKWAYPSQNLMKLIYAKTQLFLHVHMIHQSLH